MSRGSPALTAARKEEIIRACAMLNETMCFKEITIKEIGTAASFTRMFIYNCYETEEEISAAKGMRTVGKSHDPRNGAARSDDPGGAGREPGPHPDKLLDA